MDSEKIAQVAAQVILDYPEKSKLWCYATVASACGCEYKEVIKAVENHTNKKEQENA